MTTATISDKLTFVSTEVEDDTTNTEYKCKVKVQLAGDSIWDCTLETVTITGIRISETDYDGDTSTHIAVIHTGKDESWRIYTDSGFEEAVSALLGTDVTFTEQGMQEDGYASME
jgi:Fe-S cluster assembly iron-binding protein IscA